jgi:ABC-2 type transport system permease protein
MVVLILPQIGDTMDPDNQVPGGFFKSMQIDRNTEKEIMTGFQSYETIRGGIEQLSVTKHYERLSFALFGIRQMYNGMPLKEILKENTVNMVWLGSLLIAAYIIVLIVMNKNRNYLDG